MSSLDRRVGREECVLVLMGGGGEVQGDERGQSEEERESLGVRFLQSCKEGGERGSISMFFRRASVSIICLYLFITNFLSCLCTGEGEGTPRKDLQGDNDPAVVS